jgi:Tol biopolymer transport system component
MRKTVISFSALLACIIIISGCTGAGSGGSFSFPGGLAIELVSKNNTGEEGNAVSYHPCLSAEGRYVAFSSDASNLVTGDTNAQRDIFVYDRSSCSIQRVSKSSAMIEGNGGSFQPSISADGRYVAFESRATTFVSGDTNEVGDIYAAPNE